jgi:hypothetical protein
MKTTALSLFIFLLVIVPVGAGEIPLATITSDIDTDITTFYVETDERHEALGIRYLTQTRSGQITDDQRFSVQEILNGGVVLQERNNYEVVRLFLPEFRPESGGLVRLRYLVNGATGTFSALHLRLLRSGQSYSLRDSQGNSVNRLFIRGNWVRVLGLVGIRDITSTFAFF